MSFIPIVSGIANLRCSVRGSIQAYPFLPELNLIVSQVHSGRTLNLSKWARAQAHLCELDVLHFCT